MSPETIKLTLRAQEVVTESRRVCRQTAENLRLTEELIEQAELSMLGYERLLEARPPSEMQIADWYGPAAQASFAHPATTAESVQEPTRPTP
jgi:hypothetical protein